MGDGSIVGMKEIGVGADVGTRGVPVTGVGGGKAKSHRVAKAKTA
ncbi:MAG: hypothetical protein AAB372_00295 [Patescibacteria group bacterium]